MQRSLLRRAGPWQSGSITSIFSKPPSWALTRGSASVSPQAAPAAIEQMIRQPTMPPSAPPAMCKELEDRLGESPEVVIAHDGLLRRANAASPVAVAVRRNQRRLFMMALGVPLLIVLSWRGDLAEWVI